MAKLVYSALTSLDGFMEDERGRFDWAVPDEEVHAFANELERPIGTHLYGRRMYETTAVWETVVTGSPAGWSTYTTVRRAPGRPDPTPGGMTSRTDAL